MLMTGKFADRRIISPILTISVIYSVFVLILLFSLQAMAATKPIYTDAKNQVAQGYDVVAYFTAGKPIKGKAEFKTEWKDAQWLFSSAENLASFKANPEKYAPQYGGYCAWAVSNNYTARGSAQAWSIVDGKLYLNYNSSVRNTWNRNPRNNIQKANIHWPQLINR